MKNYWAKVEVKITSVHNKVHILNEVRIIIVSRAIRIVRDIFWLTPFHMWHFLRSVSLIKIKEARRLFFSRFCPNLWNALYQKSQNIRNSSNIDKMSRDTSLWLFTPSTMWLLIILSGTSSPKSVTRIIWIAHESNFNEQIKKLLNI